MSKPDRSRRGGARHVDRILTFDEFAKLNGFSVATLARAIARGEGPKVIKLSPRRFGIRERDGAAWQAERVREAETMARRRRERAQASEAAATDAA
jgi:predicted DNA-binding transcriptional regulator AlpA